MAEADRRPVAAPQGRQGRRVAAAVRGGDRGLAADPGHGGRVRDSLAAGLAAGPAAPGRCLVAAAAGVRSGWPSAGDCGRRIRLRRGRAGPGRGPGSTAGRTRPRWPRPASSLLLAPATVPAGLGLAAGLWAWRNYAITTGPGRHHRLRADHLRRPAVAAAGPHGQGPDRGARRRPAAGPGREDPGRRHHPRHRPPLGPGLHPAAAARAPGTWSSSARPAAGRRT